MINCISSATLKTFIALSATIRRKLYTIFCLIIVLFQISFGTPLNYIFFSQVTNQQISLHLQDVSHIKLFDNDRQIVSVGLQNECYISQCNMLSSESEHENKNRKVH